MSEEEIKKSVEEVEVSIPTINFSQNVDEDEYEESSNINQFGKISNQYGKINIEKEETFIDPATGQVIDKSSLTPFEQIKVTAKSMNITLNDPKKNCKKCSGRGYTGIHVSDRSPIPCSCIYETYYKDHPEQKKNTQPVLNRKQRRAYEKNLNSYYRKVIDMEVKKQEIIAKSKANLRKNTPKVEEVISEVVPEQVVNG